MGAVTVPGSLLTPAACMLDSVCGMHVGANRCWWCPRASAALLGGEERGLQAERGLLSPTRMPACMHVHAQVPVGNERELVALMAHGLGNRTVAATGMNAASSRSHCLVQLLVQRHARGGGCARGKLCLVDLAGG